MQVVTRESAPEAAHLAARHVVQAVRARDGAVIGLATGRTMEPVYAEVRRLHRDGACDFSSCRSFNLDEYVGLEACDGWSFRRFMQRHFTEVVNIDQRRVHLPAGDAEDPAGEAARYERCIAEAGGIDLQLLGIGENGHIGFNEPGTPHDAGTHVATLSAATRRQNAAMFGSEDAVPTQAITMGIGTILDARRIVLLATGRAKAAIPGSALQLHPDVVVVVDAEAAAELSAVAAHPGRDWDRGDPRNPWPR